MTDGGVGWAVWPSSGSWLLLHSTNGWSDVANRTPVAVPTGGGLVAATPWFGRITVAVGAYRRLTRSPLLAGDGTVQHWTTAQLPAPVRNSRDAVSGAAAPTVLLEDPPGSVVRFIAGAWVRLTDAKALVPSGTLHLDGITWASATLGWLTGHGPAGAPMAWQTTDGGHTWSPLADAAGAAVAALAPCGAQSAWLLPVVTRDGMLRVARTNDGGATWALGAAVALASGPPAWACRGKHLWMAGRAGGADHIYSSGDGGRSWAEAGRAPAGLTDLALTDPDRGFAASMTGKRATLWSVTADGKRFTAIPLPGWVATVGAQTSDS